MTADFARPRILSLTLAGRVSRHQQDVIKHTRQEGPHMSRVARRAFGVVGLFLSMILVTACRDTHSSQLDCSLDRVEELVVIVEGIGSDAEAEAASGRVAGWNAGWGLHDLRTAGLESVSGTSYTLLLRSKQSRIGDLRTRLRGQIHRLTVDEYLARYERHMNLALALLPRELDE